MATSRPPDSDLSRMLSASKTYWTTSGQSGAPLVLPGADLSGIDFSEHVLVEAQLQGADLTGASLNSALLMRAALDGARMDDAAMYNADASRATTTDASMSGLQAPRSIWRRATMRGADLSRALLDDCIFTAADLVSVRLRDASVTRADFSGALLLGASFHGSDVSDARFDRAAADSRTLGGALGEPVTQPEIVLRQTRSGLDAGGDTEFQQLVERELRGRRDLSVQRVRSNVTPFVVITPSERFAAIAVRATTRRLRSALNAQPDVVVVPRVADKGMNELVEDTVVVSIDQAAEAILALPPSKLKPTGAKLIADRQADRLRPYFALARRSQEDPSAVSRISTFVDDRQPFLLGSADRPVADALPAHLDGASVARGAAWAEENFERLSEFLAGVAHATRGEITETEAVSTVARYGLRLEEEVAAAARTPS